MPPELHVLSPLVDTLPNIGRGYTQRPSCDGGEMPPSAAHTPYHGGETPPSAPHTPCHGGKTPPSAAHTPYHGGETPPSAHRTSCHGGEMPPSAHRTSCHGGEMPPSAAHTPYHGGETPPLARRSPRMIAAQPRYVQGRAYGVRCAPERTSAYDRRCGTPITYGQPTSLNTDAGRAGCRNGMQCAVRRHGTCGGTAHAETRHMRGYGACGGTARRCAQPT